MSISLPRRLLSHNFIWRNFSCSPACIWEQCYKTLVRPTLEYASSVWNNTIQRSTTKVEAVQRSLACFTCHDYRHTTSVTAMLLYPQWTACHSYLNLSPAKCGPHQRVRNQLQTDPVQHKHVQSNLLNLQSDYGTPCQLMSASCRLTALRLNWTPSSWRNCRPAMFLIAPLHCFYLLRFGFLLSTPTVLTTCTAHTCTYTAVRYCSITELAPLLNEDKDYCLNVNVMLSNIVFLWFFVFCSVAINIMYKLQFFTFIFVVLMFYYQIWVQKCWKCLFMAPNLG